MKYPHLHRKIYVGSLQWGEVAKRILFAKNYLKCSDLHKRVNFSNPSSLGGEWGTGFKKCVATNCIEYPDLHRKVSLPILHPHRGGVGNQVTKNVLLEMEWNIHICTENASFPTLHPYGGGGQFSKKILCKKLNIKFRSAQENIFFQPSNPMGWGSSCKKPFLKNGMKCPDLQRLVMSTNFTLVRGGVTLIKHFGRNLMKCPYLHRKVILSNHPSCWGWWSSCNKITFLCRAGHSIQFLASNFFQLDTPLGWRLSNDLFLPVTIISIKNSFLELELCPLGRSVGKYYFFAYLGNSFNFSCQKTF